MNTTRIGAVAAVLLLGAMLVPTAAALPAQANQHAHQHVDDAPQEADEASDAQPEEAEEASDAEPHERGEAQAEARRGPPVDMPGNVPGFVTEIHEAIRGFLQGGLTAQELADSIRAATPGNATAAE